MSFTPRKYKDIFDEMRAMTQVVTDFEVGSVARTMYESFAYEMALLYEKMNLVYLSAYVDTAQGNQLDQVVAVLGIERSQPDFAEGVVSFRRDSGGQEILIPVGTLVATEETSTGEKKVYQTIKAATLGATQTGVDVQVRGVNRGEELDTAAETVVVMPRPVPGIKFVLNDAPIRLVGKRRETDTELRDRAKNALISSGKATIISIENALLSLSGVRDARVKENFHRARAKVTITKLVNGPVSPILRGTLLTLQFPIAPGPIYETRTFKVLDPIQFADSDPAMETLEVKVESDLEGKFGEVPFNTTGLSHTMAFVLPTMDFSATLLTSAALEDFGLIEVYVDAPRMEEGTEEEKEAERNRIQAEVERVRAAGIFSIILPAGKVKTSAFFRVDISPSLNLSAEERRKFEETIEDAIVGFMNDLRMGQNLLYGKLVKAILDIENVENLADFQGTITRNIFSQDLAVNFEFSETNKYIAVDEFERIVPRHICVATEDKEVIVNVAYHSPGLTAPTAETVAADLATFFGGKTLGTAVTKSELNTTITTHASISPGTLEMRIDTWCPGPADDPRVLTAPLIGSNTEVLISFVEKAVLGTVFGYANRLEIVGAIQLILPLNATNDDKIAARDGVAEAIDKLLASLGPEEDVTFEAMIAAAQSVPKVLAAKIDHKDFRALIAGVPQAAQVTNQLIDVLQLQRAFALHMCISSVIEKAVLSVQAIAVSMPLATPVASQSAVQTAIANAFQSCLQGYAAGDDVVFTDVKTKLENLVVGVTYLITTLDLRLTSQADGRIQNTTLASTQPLHVRSIEMASVPTSALSPSAITITLT